MQLPTDRRLAMPDKEVQRCVRIRAFVEMMKRNYVAWRSCCTKGCPKLLASRTDTRNILIIFLHFEQVMQKVQEQRQTIGAKDAGQTSLNIQPLENTL